MALRVRHGTSFRTIAEALDWSGNIATGDTGTVHFSVSVRGETLPANHTFRAKEADYLAFEGMILETRGRQRTRRMTLRYPRSSEA